MSRRLVLRLLRWAQLVEDALLAVLLSAMILLAATQILLRNLLDTGFAWSDPTLRILVLWIAMLGAMAATREHHHIRIDLLTRFLAPRWRRLIEGINDLFAALVCGLLAWHSGRFVWFEYQDGSILFSVVPAWIGELVLPFGFAVMALRFLLRAARNARLPGEH